MSSRFQSMALLSHHSIFPLLLSPHPSSRRGFHKDLSEQKIRLVNQIATSGYQNKSTIIPFIKSPYLVVSRPPVLAAWRFFHEHTSLAVIHHRQPTSTSHRISHELYKRGQQFPFQCQEDEKLLFLNFCCEKVMYLPQTILHTLALTYLPP